MQVPMNPQAFGPPTAIRTYPPSANHSLHLRQQSDRAKVVVRGKEKDRKPVDPPPVVQLRVNDPYNEICSFLHNPYYFCSVALWEEEADRPQSNPDKSNTRLHDSELLVGSLVSSLHRLKDLDNTEQGFFVFGDLSVAILGKFRLRFSLWEIHPDTNDVHYLRDILSAPFEVTAAKDWDGVRESTPLSRALADQGVRLRLRKESRHSSKRGYNPSAGPSLAPQTPIRPGPSHAGSYDTLSSHEGAQHGSQQQGEPDIKRRKSSQSSSSNPPSFTGYATPSTNGWQQSQTLYSTMSNQQAPYGSYAHSGHPQPAGGYQYSPMPNTSYYQHPAYASYGYGGPQARADPRSYPQGYAPQMNPQTPQQSHYDYGRGSSSAPAGQPRAETGYYEGSYGQVSSRYSAGTAYAQHPGQQSQPQLPSSQYPPRDLSSPSGDARLAPIRRGAGSDYPGTGPTQGMEDPQ